MNITFILSRLKFRNLPYQLVTNSKDLNIFSLIINALTRLYMIFKTPNIQSIKISLITNNIDNVRYYIKIRMI